MAVVKSFEGLDVYRLAVELQQEIFGLAKRFPSQEKYSLADQIRRSSRSIGANIAEAWGKRRYKAHFASKLSDADAEQLETRHWLKTSLLCGYVNEQEHKALMAKCETIGQKLGRMMSDADRWCAHY